MKVKIEELESKLKEREDKLDQKIKYAMQQQSQQKQMGTNNGKEAEKKSLNPLVAIEPEGF